ncbi:MAG: pyruvate kinase [Gammaproteobacteria bacterium]|nr:pyruvate kinase [Gammaproteobacteria bacterium]
MKNIKPIKTSLHWRRTKIIATLGPATANPTMIEKLIKAGVNVFRLNMSHGDHEQHTRSFTMVRKIAMQMGQHVAILMDLCGPKIRTGKFKNDSITLKKNSTIIISCDKKIGEQGLIVSQYNNLYKDVKKGNRILLDDGNMELRVVNISGKNITCKIIHGSILKNNKGINLPDSDVSVSSFTTKDKKDVALAMQLGADFVALSFVRSEKDVLSLVNYMKKHGHLIPVISKIERPESITNIDKIIENSYAIMVARGDLGIELPAEQVPLIQKELIAKARYMNTPVIVATQMLESMIESSRPTRAEVGDIANAALLGTDAVMLSAETASGKYPIQAVNTMDRVLHEIEAHQWQYNSFADNTITPATHAKLTIRQAVSHAVTSLAHDLKLQGIVVPTRSGTTAKILAANRPGAPLLGVSPHSEVCRRLALHWGVIPIEANEEATHNWKTLSVSLSKQCKLTKTGNTVLLVSGFDDNPDLSEPVMKILKV